MAAPLTHQQGDEHSVGVDHTAALQDMHQVSLDIQGYKGIRQWAIN